MALVIFKASRKAYSANGLTNRNTWITRLVTQRAPAGTWLRFSRANSFGMTRSLAAE
ncbi:hypothetical protein D3C80_2009510 [compost metagenome]